MTGAALVPERLRRAMAVRGLDQETLRLRVGLSRATMAALIAGRCVKPTTLRKLAMELAAIPVLPLLDELVVGPPENGIAAQADGDPAPTGDSRDACATVLAT